MEAETKTENHGGSLGECKYLKHPTNRFQACRSLTRIAELQSDQLAEHRLFVSPTQSPQDLWLNEPSPAQQIPPGGNHHTQSSFWAHPASFVGKHGLEWDLLARRFSRDPIMVMMEIRNGVIQATLSPPSSLPDPDSELRR